MMLRARPSLRPWAPAQSDTLVESAPMDWVPARCRQFWPSRPRSAHRRHWLAPPPRPNRRSGPREDRGRTRSQRRPRFRFREGRLGGASVVLLATPLSWDHALTRDVGRHGQPAAGPGDLPLSGEFIWMRRSPLRPNRGPWLEALQPNEVVWSDVSGLAFCALLCDRSSVDARVRRR